MRKILISATALFMSVSVLMAGCSTSSSPEGANSTATAEELTPDGKYAETVTYTVGKSTPGIPKLPAGQSYEDNAFTQYLKETLNIQNENKFEAQSGDNYDQKVAMAVASDDLPDIMAVD
ncbi:hypothetical protein MKX33_18510 [Paenibacillus sp. FSL R5-0490]|uniref:hypothetical protein n=1 Tax=Paenibacillus sp. FSL R5-0490 TaxID=1920424 RepID=UPI0030D2BD1E